MDGVLHHRILPAAKTVSHGNARTDGQADEEIHHQVGQRTGRAHGGYADTAAELTHHHQVGGVEQQLK